MKADIAQMYQITLGPREVTTTENITNNRKGSK